MKKLALLMVLTTALSCGKKDSSSTAPAANGTVSAPVGIEGSWASGCVAGSGQEINMVITATTFRLAQKLYTTPGCDVGTERGLSIEDYTYAYDTNTELADLVVTHGYVTLWDTTMINELNDADDSSGICGTKDWQVGVQKEITNITPCTAGSSTTGNTLQYPLSLSGPNTLILAGAYTLTRQ